MLTTTAASSLSTPAPASGSPRPWKGPGRLTAYWLLMAGSFVCYILGHVLKGSGGAAQTLLNMAGAGACGWAWLIARALFDPERQDAWWPRIVVFVVVASGALAVLPLPAAAAGITNNLYALAGSAALLLTFFEPFHRYRPEMPAGEKRFRFAFVVVYALLVAVSILAPGPADATPLEAYRIDLLKSACAFGGLVAGTVAVGVRIRHPLAPKTTAGSARRAPTPDDKRLADRMLDLLHHENIYAEPSLKVADLALRLGQPEHRISQCVTAVLGFDNFNRMINHYRIKEAKRLLADPDQRRSILDVAFECGFGSVGPFNRAFRAETGVAPRVFRAGCRRA